MKSALTGGNELALLAECGDGELAAVQEYAAALERDLPADLRPMLERHLTTSAKFTAVSRRWGPRPGSLAASRPAARSTRAGPVDRPPSF